MTHVAPKLARTTEAFITFFVVQCSVFSQDATEMCYKRVS